MSERFFESLKYHLRVRFYGLKLQQKTKGASKVNLA